MTDIDALTAFCRARLDEEERDAKAATLGPWVTEPDGRPGGGLVITGRLRSQYGEPVSVVWGPNTESVLLNGDATHIARQDPATTFARVAALRKMVEEFQPQGWRCEGHTAAEWAICLLTAIWRDHPDWREEWTA